MTAKALQLMDVIDKLDDRQLDALYNVAVCFVAQNDFDYISPQDSEMIARSFNQIQQGECVSFESSEEMLAYFGG